MINKYLKQGKIDGTIKKNPIQNVPEFCTHQTYVYPAKLCPQIIILDYSVLKKYEFRIVYYKR